MIGSPRFQMILAVRFFGYFAFFTGLLLAVLTIEPVIGEEGRYRLDQLFGIEHTIDSSIGQTAQQIITSQGIAQAQPSAKPTVSLGGIEFSTEKSITPASTEYGIVIEKINANAKVIPNVHPGDEAEYMQALVQGVAATSGSTPPGQPGNLYIFSHSTDAPWNIVRYNAIFYLLGKLDTGDKIVVFYQGKRYDYIVYDKTVTDPSNISFLSNRYDKPVLTLQTCDPPGTTLNRLIVRARLQSS